MAVLNETSTVTYVGRGDTGPYTITFDVELNDSQNAIGVTVLLIDSSGVISDITSSCTIMGINVYTSVAYDSSYKVQLTRNPSFTQENNFVYGSSFPSALFNKALDKLTMMAQMLKSRFDRMFFYPLDETPPPLSKRILPPKETRASHHLAFDSNGDIMISTGVPDVPTSDFGKLLIEKQTAEEVRKHIELAIDYPSSGSMIKFEGGSAVEWLFLFTDVKSIETEYLQKKNPFSYTENKIIVKKNTIIPLFDGSRWKVYHVFADIELSESDLDTGTFAVGNDYYVYLCDNGGNGTFKISLNSTYPAGYTATTSRKVGGFHYGHIRKVSSDGLWVPIDGAGNRFGSTTIIWKNNVTIGIVPNSVWDLKNRPLCSPEGMVKVGSIWVDIYLSSAAETVTFEGGTNGRHIATGRLQSKYGQILVTGTEGLCWYNFVELASRIGKRLLTKMEWVQAANGNPQGQDSADDYGWTKTTNSDRTRTGCRVDPSTGQYNASTGIKPYAISAYNCVDCVGNVWEWLDELSNRHDSTTWNWYDVMSGWEKGQIYAPNNTGVVALLAGAYWNTGARAGARAVSVYAYPWYVYSFIGARLACDSL